MAKNVPVEMDAPTCWKCRPSIERLAEAARKPKHPLGASPSAHLIHGIGVFLDGYGFKKTDTDDVQAVNVSRWAKAKLN